MGGAVLVTLENTVKALEALGARYCIVGGIARGLLAESRSTTDVDFAVAVDSQDELDALIRGLGSAGFVVREIFLKQQTKNVATARLTWGDSSVRADLLFETSGIERLVVEQAGLAEVLPGIEAPVISRDGLIAMKLIAGREQDLADIGALMDAGAADHAAIARLLRASSHPRREEAIALWAEVQRRRAARQSDLVASPEAAARFRSRSKKRPPRRS